jgi:hypothetical protein
LSKGKGKINCPPCPFINCNYDLLNGSCSLAGVRIESGLAARKAFEEES